MIDNNYKMNNNYFFCGIKHSGKTTHAKLFANRNNYNIVDADDLIIELLKGQPIRDFYKKQGKKAFIDVEFEAIDKFIKNPLDGTTVLSLGGGICDNKKAVELLKTNGIIIFIKVDEKTLYNRIVIDGIPPFLEDNPKEKFHKLFLEREKKYLSFSDIIIEVKDRPIVETSEIINTEINKWISNVTQ